MHCFSTDCPFFWPENVFFFFFLRAPLLAPILARMCAVAAASLLTKWKRIKDVQTWWNEVILANPAPDGHFTQREDKLGKETTWQWVVEGYFRLDHCSVKLLVAPIFLSSNPPQWHTLSVVSTQIGTLKNTISASQKEKCRISWELEIRFSCIVCKFWVWRSFSSNKSPIVSQKIDWLHHPTFCIQITTNHFFA